MNNRDYYSQVKRLIALIKEIHLITTEFNAGIFTDIKHGWEHPQLKLLDNGVEWSAACHEDTDLPYYDILLGGKRTWDVGVSRKVAAKIMVDRYQTAKTNRVILRLKSEGVV